MSLSDALYHPSRFVLLYGTTPPRLDAPIERYERAVKRLAERVRDTAIDGLVVYDVQDESERTAEPRPFPFLPTFPSRTYATRLREATSLETVTYKCVSGLTADDWNTWLDETASQQAQQCLSLVGRASSRSASTGISLPQALTITAEHPGGFTLGGVVIPERHRPDATPPRNESVRLCHKMEWGCRYFISQAVYEPEAAIRLLRDYHQDCVARNIRPCRILFTFTPCGRPKTLEFMRWLGIHIPDTVAHALAIATDPLATSVALCIENWRRIQDSGMGDLIPLGVNVESVSNSKEEIAASISLCNELRNVR